MADHPKTLYLIDASSFMYRSFHAVRGLTRSDGFPTNAIFGFFNMVRSLLNTHSPEYLALVFDLPDPTFRHEAFEAYKAQRKETPEDLVKQIPHIKQLSDLYGLSVLEKSGFEADDIIGTLATKAKGEGFRATIVTNDKDLMQLVCPEIGILHVHGQNSKAYDEQSVQERYGVAPSQVVDLLGLMGDSSDNIPGVPGIGEKTAASLLQRFGTLDTVLEQTSTIEAKKVRENLQQYREQALLSRELATIRCDVPLDIALDDLRVREPDVPGLRSVLSQLEFTSWLKELPQDEIPVSTPKDYQTVDTLDKLTDLCSALKDSDGFAFDTETTGLDTHTADLVGMSFSCGKGGAWYAPVGHLHGTQLPLHTVREALKPVFEDATIPKAGHNLKFDLPVLEKVGIQVQGQLFDTLVAAYLIEGGEARKSLDHLAAQHFGWRMTPIEDLIGKGKNAVTMDLLDIRRVSEYASEDAEAAWLLWEHYQPLLKAEQMESLFRDVEMPLVQVLANMERIGVCVNVDELASQSAELERMMNVTARDIYRQAGVEFNLNSPKQLAEVLFDKMKLPKVSRTSTRADVLTRLAEQGFPIATTILEYRQIQKLKSTYLDALPNLVNPRTGRLHTSYNQTVTNTGRLSSSEPNLQNIPIRTEMGKRIRRAFVPSEGCVLLGADYSQIELRILAHVSEDPGLRTAFERGTDIHTHTASEVFEVPASEVTSELRRRAKEINFGLNYGMSPYGLSERLGISVPEAADYMDRYFARYPRVREYVDKTLEQARHLGYVSTLLGRKVKTPGLTDESRTTRDNASRAAINAPIQGSAADLLKVAMVRIPQRIREAGFEASMILTIHDELIFDCPEGECEGLSALVQREMESAMSLSVPIKVDLKVGENWAEL